MAKQKIIYIDMFVCFYKLCVHVVYKYLHKYKTPNKTRELTACANIHCQLVHDDPETEAAGTTCQNTRILVLS